MKSKYVLTHLVVVTAERVVRNPGATSCVTIYFVSINLIISKPHYVFVHLAVNFLFENIYVNGIAHLMLKSRQLQTGVIRK